MREERYIYTRYEMPGVGCGGLPPPVVRTAALILRNVRAGASPTGQAPAPYWTRVFFTAAHEKTSDRRGMFPRQWLVLAVPSVPGTGGGLLFTRKPVKTTRAGVIFTPPRLPYALEGVGGAGGPVGAWAKRVLMRSTMACTPGVLPLSLWPSA